MFRIKKRISIATFDPTDGHLPATAFPPDEHPDPPQDPGLAVLPDGVTKAVAR